MRISEIETLKLPDIEVGDDVLVGKFKNRKAKVTGFAKDDHSQPVLKTTKGDQKLFKPRFPKLDEKRAFSYENRMEKKVPVFIDPTKTELAIIFERTRYGKYIRGFLYGKHAYVWDGGNATHWEIANELGVGLNEVLGFEITPEDGVMFLLNPSLHDGIDPEEVVARLKAHPSFRDFPVGWKRWRN